MKLADAVAFFGHQVHICRFREAGTLLRWMGDDLRGKKVLDVAGGDGYWAGRARRRGALAVSLDLARSKMLYGKTLAHAPALIEGDALALPFADASFDAVLSVCAIEHFTDGARSLAEMARVLKPGGELFLSADVLSRADAWPKLRDAHKAKYHVQHTYTHRSLGELMGEHGLEMVTYSYQFRTAAAERLYLSLSAYGGRVGFNAAAPLVPLVALADRRAPNERGSIVLVRARKRP
ncbi:MULTISPECIES: class I SAM-dependent methyltransferase [Thermomonospora]|uniref:Methyltransferase type 11 n=1 Tax=Thermomonospora curvata (strain ATCC 19995 / DSM 43183 / JCM 3096 / KCTC 9072 / NBRC 15933 / NCIMB 10081 / Henssen B9) TaxID=471852 RepID=D1AF66_THECD|nr:MULTISPECIES: class I SAM-dependent methyltransferase [Thermomonospora]ACY99610.1 Methyltransferase type 11 [Thermomonospora curvata DSM 43183]PKK12638.1 MAG: class I SAM-dependent methyltransferase [Thermomonospora sp. CIF 1]